jgi:predicted Zn-dependent protease
MRHLWSVLLLGIWAGQTAASPIMPEAPKSPPSTRQQVSSDPKHQKDLDSDIESGVKIAAEVDKELKPTDNVEYQLRVEKIGAELAEIANKTPILVSWGDTRVNTFAYRFKVVKGEDVNAFSIPGGFIYVYEGLVKFMESDSELAGVLAHEITHASLRHMAMMSKEQSKVNAITLPILIAAILAGGGNGDGMKIAQGISMVTQALTSGWSVKAEQSADFGALQYMERSKYNPVGVLTMMERLAYKERSSPKIEWGIYRTHPPSTERAAYAVQKLKDAGYPIRRSEVTTSLRASVKPGENGHVELWFGNAKVHAFGGSDALTRADSAAFALNTFFDAVPALYELKLKDKTLVGKGARLFEITSDDLEKPDQTLADLANKTFNAMRSIVFDAAYRVWDYNDLEQQ